VRLHNTAYRPEAPNARTQELVVVGGRLRLELFGSELKNPPGETQRTAQESREALGLGLGKGADEDLGCVKDVVKGALDSDERATFVETVDGDVQHRRTHERETLTPPSRHCGLVREGVASPLGRDVDQVFPPRDAKPSGPQARAFGRERGRRRQATRR
jgi:hypothetical protein